MSTATKGPDNREIRKWVEAGGPLVDWPMLNVHCLNCSLAVRRCRDEIAAIAERCWHEEREPTEAEATSISVFTDAIPVLSQGDAAMYPSPAQGPNAPDIDDAVEWSEAMAQPTTICPRCSTPAAEQTLRHECIDAGYGILPTGVFVTQPANQDEPRFEQKGAARS